MQLGISKYVSFFSNGELVIDYNIDMQKIRVSILLFLIALGFIIVALPDSGPRLFSMSTDHGPSLQDTIGLAIGLISYIYLVVIAWKRKDRLNKYLNSKIFRSGLFLFGLGLGLVIASVFRDNPNWWLLGGLIMLIIQVPILYVTLK